MQNPKQQLDPMHKLSYHMNDFLSTEQGNQIANQMQNQFPEVANAIKSQVTVHKKVLNHFAKLSRPAAKQAADTLAPVPGTNMPGQGQI